MSMHAFVTAADPDQAWLNRLNIVLDSYGYDSFHENPRRNSRKIPQIGRLGHNELMLCFSYLFNKGAARAAGPFLGWAFDYAGRRSDDDTLLPHVRDFLLQQAIRAPEVHDTLIPHLEKEMRASLTSRLKRGSSLLPRDWFPALAVEAAEHPRLRSLLTPLIEKEALPGLVRARNAGDFSAVALSWYGFDPASDFTSIPGVQTLVDNLVDTDSTDQRHEQVAYREYTDQHFVMLLNMIKASSNPANRGLQAQLAPYAGTPIFVDEDPVFRRKGELPRRDYAATVFVDVSRPGAPAAYAVENVAFIRSGTENFFMRGGIIHDPAMLFRSHLQGLLIKTVQQKLGELAGSSETGVAAAARSALMDMDRMIAAGWATMPIDFGRTATSHVPGRSLNL